MPCEALKIRPSAHYMTVYKGLGFRVPLHRSGVRWCKYLTGTFLGKLHMVVSRIGPILAAHMIPGFFRDSECVLGLISFDTLSPRSHLIP